MKLGRDSGFIIGPDDSTLGIALGADFWAEHEVGIGGIRKMFAVLTPFQAMRSYDEIEERRTLGIKRSPLMGLARRRIQHVPDALTMDHANHRDVSALHFSEHPDDVFGEKRHQEPLICLWDDRRFHIIASGEENRRRLSEIYDAFRRRDIVLSLPVDLPEAKGLVGPKIYITSRLPASIDETLIAEDEDRILLLKTAHKTGIADRLQAAGRHWYALSPAWNPNKPGTVWFWLNPMEQKANNYGWWTVEELDQWALGTGPIVNDRSRVA